MFSYNLFNLLLKTKQICFILVLNKIIYDYSWNTIVEKVVCLKTSLEDNNKIQKKNNNKQTQNDIIHHLIPVTL